MKYIKVFENTTARDAFLANAKWSVLQKTNGVEGVGIHKYTPAPTPSHDYVEIDGVKWATMNIGAESVTDYGLYFQWGDTQGYTASQVGSGSGQKYFGWGDYKYNSGDENNPVMSKYNSTDGSTHLSVLQSSDDAVHAAWGGNWRMPTAQEFLALCDAVDAVWTTNYDGSGVNGVVCTDKTDSSKVLFFPGAGRCGRGNVIMPGAGCSYHSSSLAVSGNDFTKAFYLSYSTQFSSATLHVDGSYRFIGSSLRGVLDE